MGVGTATHWPATGWRRSAAAQSDARASNCATNAASSCSLSATAAADRSSSSSPAIAWRSCQATHASPAASTSREDNSLATANGANKVLERAAATWSCGLMLINMGRQTSKDQHANSAPQRPRPLLRLLSQRLPWLDPCFYVFKMRLMHKKTKQILDTELKIRLEIKGNETAAYW